MANYEIELEEWVYTIKGSDAPYKTHWSVKIYRDGMAIGTTKEYDWRWSALRAAKKFIKADRKHPANQRIPYGN